MDFLRDYQEALKTDIYNAYDAGHQNVLAVMPTGAGKTRLFTNISNDFAIAGLISDVLKYKLRVNNGILPTAILVHRKELVQQISATLASQGILHSLIAPNNVIKDTISIHRRKFNRSFYQYGSQITVISVDTLNSRILKHRPWAEQIKFWITDEAAHLIADNKWGRAVKYFPNAIGLGVTATPERLDKKGLGRHADGVFDIMVQGPTTKWLIDNGHLAKYKIVIPESDYQNHLIAASANSDFSKEAMMKASKESRIVGDVVSNYLKFASGKQTIIFATDKDAARRMSEGFTSVGVVSKVLTAETPDKERANALIDFENKKINVLINIDLFDEGLDIPGIEVVILARPTMALSKFLQSCGRVLRPVYAAGYDLSTVEGRLEAQLNGGKPFALIIDHVGNIKRHGLPCKVREWTLDRIASKKKKLLDPLRVCWNFSCRLEFDRTEIHCPYCGVDAINPNLIKRPRTGPAEVDGDLFLLDPAVLRALDEASILEDPGKLQRKVAAVAGSNAGKAAAAAQVERFKVQTQLREAIAKWARKRKNWGYSDRKIHKEFYNEFGKTVAQMLAEPKATMERHIWELE